MKKLSYLFAFLLVFAVTDGYARPKGCKSGNAAKSYDLGKAGAPCGDAKLCVDRCYKLGEDVFYEKKEKRGPGGYGYQVQGRFGGANCCKKGGTKEENACAHYKQGYQFGKQCDDQSNREGYACYDYGLVEGWGKGNKKCDKENPDVCKKEEGRFGQLHAAFALMSGGSTKTASQKQESQARSDQGTTGCDLEVAKTTREERRSYDFTDGNNVNAFGGTVPAGAGAGER